MTNSTSLLFTVIYVRCSPNSLVITLRCMDGLKKSYKRPKRRQVMYADWLSTRATDCRESRPRQLRACTPYGRYRRSMRAGCMCLISERLYIELDKNPVSPPDTLQSPDTPSTYLSRILGLLHSLVQSLNDCEDLEADEVGTNVRNDMKK